MAVMLDVFAVTRDRDFLESRLLPVAREILTFYREHFRERSRDGKIVLAPSQSLETWHEAVNPLPDIAGLKWILEGLLKVGGVPEDERAQWRELQELLPPLPQRTYFWEKRTELIDALQYNNSMNFENPALYAVFPYRLFGAGKPERETGRETWRVRRFKESSCWRQDAIQAALLGLTDEAKRLVLAYFEAPLAKGVRFPAFWGPHFDWLPDQDHGGVGMTALQRMVLHWESSGSLLEETGPIWLLPSWPDEWDVTFKLWAPGNTMVECEFHHKQIKRLKVTPETRTKDIITEKPFSQSKDQTKPIVPPSFS